MNIRQWAAAYFCLQGVAVASWWLLLLFFPSTRVHFQSGVDSEAALLAFWLPDLSLLVFGSLLTSSLLLRDSRFASAAAWFTCGTVSYASLYCFSLAIMTDSSWLGVTLMIPSMLLSFTCTLAVSQSTTRVFRQANLGPRWWNVTKTCVQIIFFWGVILFLIPFLITRLEERLDVPHFEFEFQKTIAAVFFSCMSGVGLWSAYTMAVAGHGTPLPVDSPRRLVVSGPYAHVRNPMALSGLGQGISVGLWLGSHLVLIYVLIGVWIWQCLVRPLEEGDMQQQFGAAYFEYRRNVRCWWPRLRAYAGSPSARE